MSVALTTILYATLLVAAVGLSLLALMYSLQCIVAVLHGPGLRLRTAGGTLRERVAVVIPAHDEAAGIGKLLGMLLPLLQNGDRLIVVADNCTDDTADIARGFDAIVLERHHATERGKSYALDHAIRHLETEPPSIVVFLDADSSIEDNTLDELVGACQRLGRPVQARFVMLPLEGSLVNSRVSSFGNLMKNHVRLLGLRTLGLPSHLTGSGMAFPWQVIRAAELAHGHLTEDKKLGIDLALAGHPPYYCAEAIVWTEAPYSTLGASTQRERWEKGHLSLTRLAPAIVVRSLRDRNLGLFMLGLDLAVPPMVLLILTLSTLMLPALALALLVGGMLPLWIISCALALVLLSTMAAWWRFGREVLPAGDLPLILPFVVSKLALYTGSLFKRADLPWIRTDRTRPKE